MFSESAVSQQGWRARKHLRKSVGELQELFPDKLKTGPFFSNLTTVLILAGTVTYMG